MNAFSECAGSFSMNDSYMIQMSQISIIQIFVQFCNGFVNGFAQKINFCPDRSGFIHFDLSGSGAAKGRAGNDRFIQKLQIGNRNLGSQNTHLYKKHTFGIWFGTDGSFYVHT